MMSLVAVLLLAATDAKDDGAKVSVDSVTVNGEKTSGTVSGAASTTTHAGQQWSAVTARTVGAGGNLLLGSVGFPGVSVAVLHGMSGELDLGGRFSVNYGWEGQITTVQPGIKLQGVARYKFLDNGKLNLGASFSPGLLFYFPGRSTQVGFAVPLGLTLGIVASSALNVALSFEIPTWILFGNQASVVFPLLAGAGVEYFLSSTLALFFELRMGPSIWTSPAAAPNGSGAVFTFDGKLGIGWRF